MDGDKRAGNFGCHPHSPGDVGYYVDYLGDNHVHGLESFHGTDYFHGYHGGCHDGKENHSNVHGLESFHGTDCHGGCHDGEENHSAEYCNVSVSCNLLARH